MIDAGRIDEALRAAGQVIDGVSVAQDGSVEIQWPASATLEQRQAGEAALAGIVAVAPLAEAKAARLADLDAWYAAAAASGVQAAGMLWDARLEAQNRVDALVTMILAAISVGAATAETPFTAYARDGEALALPAGQLMGVLLQYGQTCAALSAGYAACLAAIGATTTPEDALAVPLPA